MEVIRPALSTLFDIIPVQTTQEAAGIDVVNHRIPLVSQFPEGIDDNTENDVENDDNDDDKEGSFNSVAIVFPATSLISIIITSKDESEQRVEKPQQSSCMA